MQIKKDNFSIQITGKCKTQADIIQLFNFGMSINGITKKYSKDNKIKIDESRRTVENIIYNKVIRNK